MTAVNDCRYPHRMIATQLYQAFPWLWAPETVPAVLNRDFIDAYPGYKYWVFHCTRTRNLHFLAPHSTPEYCSIGSFTIYLRKRKQGTKSAKVPSWKGPRAFARKATLSATNHSIRSLYVNARKFFKKKKKKKKSQKRTSKLSELADT